MRLQGTKKWIRRKKNQNAFKFGKRFTQAIRHPLASGLVRSRSRIYESFQLELAPPCYNSETVLTSTFPYSYTKLSLYLFKHSIFRKRKLALTIIHAPRIKIHMIRGRLHKCIAPSPMRKRCTISRSCKERVRSSTAYTRDQGLSGSSKTH